MPFGKIASDAQPHHAWDQALDSAREPAFQSAQVSHTLASHAPARVAQQGQSAGHAASSCAHACSAWLTWCDAAVSLAGIRTVCARGCVAAPPVLVRHHQAACERPQLASQGSTRPIRMTWLCSRSNVPRAACVRRRCNARALQERICSSCKCSCCYVFALQVLRYSCSKCASSNAHAMASAR